MKEERKTRNRKSLYQQSGIECIRMNKKMKVKKERKTEKNGGLF